MKKYMTIRDYSEESGFPEKLLRRLCRTDKGQKFAHRANGSGNEQYLITVPVFEKMWEGNEFQECL